MVPAISKPADDADKTVFVELVFISNASALIDMCSPLVSPIVVVEPNDATVVDELVLTSKESLSILMCCPLVPPIVVVAPNDASVTSVPPVSTIKSTESLSIKILDWSLASCPIVVVAP